MPEESSNFDPEYKRYEDWVKALRKLAAEYGFKGQLHANEVTYLSAYPQNKKKPARPDWNYDISELTKAKYIARMLFIHAGLDVQVFWNETWNNQHVYRDVGLLRNSFSADPDSPLTTQPAYYVMRTCANVLDGAKPADIKVSLSINSPQIEKYTFTNADGQQLIAIWQAIREDDNFAGQQIDVTIPNTKFSRVVGIDTLNGFEQELVVNKTAKGLHLPKLIIGDYPLVLKLQ